MGSVRIEVYNHKLMNSYSYHKISHIKALLSNIGNLEMMSARGDQVAAAILIDLKTCLGAYGLDQTILTEQEIDIIRYNLVYGIPQEEIAEMLGVGQSWVSVLMKQGLLKMRQMLGGGSGCDESPDG